jgi:hypothetical protein
MVNKPNDEELAARAKTGKKGGKKGKKKKK